MIKIMNSMNDLEQDYPPHQNHNSKRCFPYFACDAQLMTVEDDPLKISQQVALCARLRAPVRDPSSQLVQFRPCLADLLRRVDHVVRRLDPPAALDEVRHVGHDGAHVLGEHDDVIVAVLPLGNLDKKKQDKNVRNGQKNCSPP